MKIMSSSLELAADLGSLGLVLLGQELLDGQQRIRDGRVENDPPVLPCL